MMSMPRTPTHSGCTSTLPLIVRAGDFGATNKPEALSETPEMAAAEPIAGERETFRNENHAIYAIRAGDSLCGITARSYGSARQRHRITEANPGLDPRRLRVAR